MRRALLDILVPGYFLALSFTLPFFDFSFDIATFLTATSLIFAILAGFFFAAATSNYLRLQTLISEINAGFIGLYAIARVIDRAKAEMLSEKIDAYMMADLDYELLDFDMVASYEFKEIVRVIDEVKPVDERGVALLGLLHEKKEALRVSGFETGLTAKTIVSPGHWTVLTLLSLLVVILTLALRDGSVASGLFSGAIVITVYLVLRLLHAIDSNLFLAKNLAFQDAQKVFMGINQLPYYPQYALQRGYVRSPKAPYRVGNSARGAMREVRTIKT